MALPGIRVGPIVKFTSTLFGFSRLGTRARGGGRCVWHSQRCSFHSSSFRNQCNSATSSQDSGAKTDKPWRLISAVCLERFPVISQEMSEVEQSYLDMVKAVEFERSALSLHEIAVTADRKRMEKKQAGEQEADEDEEGDDGGGLMTALDVEDIATEELSKFQAASRITAADEGDDRRSLNRRLTDKLVLLVKCRVGDDRTWMLPHGLREEGETMKEAAQRVLTNCSAASGSLQAHFMGNAPVGFFKQRFPRAVQEETGSAGLKVFFFKAQYMTGNFSTSEDETMIEDFVWVTPSELEQYLGATYHASVKKFIFPV
ncbi:large ribosomal subunit protein mL46-like [Diadema antillarum]|uniref:large ribosomal subunit protein mL46-like n=1 Tax=Diadema antillarum TaxID=105358 RepID=UPI003A85221D